MERIQLDSFDVAGAVQKAADVVRSGGILVYPTDTVYGLGCDPFLESALRRLARVKLRSDSRYVVLERDSEAVTRWTSKVPDSLGFFAQRLWPGPVTMIFSKDPARGPLRGNDSIGMRVPNFDFLQKLLSALAMPLVSTSVNRSGSAPLGDPEQIWEEFREDIDLFLDGGTFPARLPSSVVDLRPQAPQILRRGSNAAAIEAAIQEWIHGQHNEPHA